MYSTICVSALIADTGTEDVGAAAEDFIPLDRYVLFLFSII